MPEENKNQKENEPLGYYRGYKKETNNTPKKEAKAQYTDPRDSKRYSSSNLVVVVVILSVIITSGILMYLLYAFIHVTHLSDLAGVHVTKEFQQAASQVMNKNANDYALAGYEDWQTYKNNFLEFKYPADWQLQEAGGQIDLKKYNSKQYNYFDSLALSTTLGEFDNSNGAEMKKVLEDNHRTLGRNFQETEIAGKKAMRTGKVTLENELVSDGIYWDLGGKIYYLEGTYYNSQNTRDLESEFEKFVNSVKFL